MRVVIYQLFVRHFSNITTGGKDHGDRASNGCGTFNEINDTALASLSRLGITHIWLTGVLRHATLSTYGGQQSATKSLVKGKAGSPYAVSDYFDVNADLAENPARRMEEFESLVERIRRWGMVPLIDFTPNHVSRDYRAEGHPHWDFPHNRDKCSFFSRDEPYYYLDESNEGRPPFKLPLGVYKEDLVCPRVTGNNAATWNPSLYDWYETVKLNYGIDYRQGPRACESLPDALSLAKDVPRTWRVMDHILAYWQGKGVGGFRCDMAHMVPMPFWEWVSMRCRLRDEHCLLIAEAYNDHMKLVEGDVQQALLHSGFDAVYDAPSYEGLRALYEGGAWANDLDRHHHSDSPLYRGGVRYLENHDEPRLCAPQYWGGQGGSVRRALSIAQYASSQGPILFYNGQEVGERAEGPCGFGGNRGRTSIFDYTSLPRLQRWVNQHRYDGAELSAEERVERAWMGDLLRLMQQPAFAQGAFYGLNWANHHSAGYGTELGDPCSGHWFYAFLRYDRVSNQCYLALCNLSSEEDTTVTVNLPEHARHWCKRNGEISHFTSVLGVEQGSPLQISRDELECSGLTLSLSAGEGLLLLWE